jgi:hypothetical protein
MSSMALLSDEFLAPPTEVYAGGAGFLISEPELECVSCGDVFAETLLDLIRGRLLLVPSYSEEFSSYFSPLGSVLIPNTTLNKHSISINIFHSMKLCSKMEQQ